ncbi:MAG: hypothetical protein A2W91_08700 [Bacteroidetes bacterium GWF2_38_335]|nr:MAG: hypothetical protein A2W91_08700 [Bacteroidetes bacterium GWF2_38_335]OFY80454.1 MAG: hypothetical protein A2281_08425 [Bacteroidetes bacterium RIFOXYA12_FULL_38_20]HBS85941.1 hypothetical protein [Bacteroidales bacterium]
MKNSGKILLLVFCLFFAFIINGNCQTQDDTKTDWKSDGLIGKVKSIKTVKYIINDTSGEILPGEIKCSESAEYNENGGKIESDDQYSNNSKYKYDDKNKSVECTTLKLDKSINVIISKFDAKGNETATYKKCPNDSIILRTIVKNVYDEKENLIEKSINNSDGSLNYKYTYKYDDKGNMIEKCGSCCGNYSDKRIYIYNEKGIAIEMSFYNSNGKLETNEKYDDKGNLIEMTWYKPNGKKISGKSSIQYEYDQKGNWIKSIQKDGPYITLREIVYY